MDLSGDEWFDVSLEENSITAIRVKDGIFIGNHAAASERDLLVLHKITHVINCAGEEIPDYFANDPQEEFKYLSFPWHDIGLGGSMSIPPPILFDSKNENLSRTVAFIDDALEKGECVLVHSRLGMSRAPALLAGYFVAKYGWRPSNALIFLQCVHPGIAIQPPFLSQIHALALQFPVDVDIFDEDVDDSLFGLDNDQWILRNTLLNCLHHYEQEENQLYQTCIKHVDIGVEVAESKEISSEDRGNEKTVIPNGAKGNFKKRLSIRDVSKNGNSTKKEDERKKRRGDSGKQTGHVSGATPLQPTEKSIPFQALHPQSRKKKKEHEKSGDRNVDTKSNLSRTVVKGNSQIDPQNTPRANGVSAKRNVSNGSNAVMASSIPSSSSRSQRRIWFFDTQKGTKVDCPNSNPVFSTSEIGGEKLINEALFSHAWIADPRPSRPHFSSELTAQALESRALDELSEFVGGRGIAALLRHELQKSETLGTDGTMEPVRKSNDEIASSTIDIEDSQEPYSSRIPIPKEGTSKSKDEKNNDSIPGVASSVTSSGSLGTSFSRSNSLLRRRCTSPCQYRLISDPEACPKGKQHLIKRCTSPYSRPTSNHTSLVEAPLQVSKPPTSITHPPHVRAGTDQGSNEPHDFNHGITKILSKRQNTSEEHVDPYCRSGGLPPPLPSLSPDGLLTGASLPSVETEEEDEAARDKEDRSEPDRSTAPSSLALFHDPQLHPLKMEYGTNEKEHLNGTRLSPPATMPALPGLTWATPSEITQSAIAPPPSQQRFTISPSPPSSFDPTTQQTSQPLHLSSGFPTATTPPDSALFTCSLSPSNETKADGPFSREVSPLPTKRVGGALHHHPEQTDKGRLGTGSMSLGNTSGITVAAGHEYHPHPHPPAAGGHITFTTSIFPSSLTSTRSRSPDLNRAVMMLDVGSRGSPTTSHSVADSTISGDETDKKQLQVQQGATAVTVIPVLSLDHLDSAAPLTGSAHSGIVSTPVVTTEGGKKLRTQTKASSLHSHSGKPEKKKRQKKMGSPSATLGVTATTPISSQVSVPTTVAKETTGLGSLSVHLQRETEAAAPPRAGRRSRCSTMYSRLCFSQLNRKGSPLPRNVTRTPRDGGIHTARSSSANDRSCPSVSGLSQKGKAEKGDLEEEQPPPTITSSGRLQVRSFSSPRPPLLTTPHRGGEQRGEGAEGGGVAQRSPNDLEGSGSLSILSSVYLKPPHLHFSETPRISGSLGVQGGSSYSAQHSHSSKGRKADHDKLFTPLSARSGQKSQDMASNDTSLSSLRGSSASRTGKRKDRRSPAIASFPGSTSTIPPPIKLFGYRPSLAPPPQPSQGLRLTTIGAPRTASSRSSSSVKCRSYSNHSNSSRTSQASSSGASENRCGATLGSSLISSQKSSQRCPSGPRNKDKANLNGEAPLRSPHPSREADKVTSQFLPTTTFTRISAQEVLKKHQLSTSVPQEEKSGEISTEVTRESIEETITDFKVIQEQDAYPSAKKKKSIGSSSGGCTILSSPSTTKMSKTSSKMNSNASKR